MPQRTRAPHVGVPCAHHKHAQRVDLARATPAIHRHASADRRVPRVTLAVQGRALREECIR